MLTIRSSDIDLYPGSQEERLPGFSAQFPHICSHVLLPDGPAGACTWHWHKSMELFYVEKGALVYHTPGGQRLFRAGSGGMVNSNVLHRTQSLKNGTALRLQMASQLLLQTKLAVTDIAQRCGLGSSSYFGAQFRQHFGCSPTAYRAKWQDIDTPGHKSDSRTAASDATMEP